jgi:hypothetical protein
VCVPMKCKIYRLKIIIVPMKHKISTIVVILVAARSRHQCCNHCLPYQYQYDQSNRICHLKMRCVVPRHVELNKFTDAKGKKLICINKIYSCS